eukprot:gene20432-biopygen4087
MVQRNAPTLSSSSGAALRKHGLHRREDVRWGAFRFTTHCVACVAVPGYPPLFQTSRLVVWIIHQHGCGA